MYPLEIDRAIDGRASRGVLGILGGMGPAATADFYRKLVAATPAVTDQDHIPVVVVGDPRILDRAQAIGTRAESDVLAGMLQRLRHLERAGVDAVAMPCNTAHYWLPGLRAATDIPFISLVEASVAEARRHAVHARTVLVLGTAATVNSRIYEAELARSAFISVVPEPEQQEEVNRIIAFVKAGAVRDAQARFEAASESWCRQADVVLLACTELPLAAERMLQDRNNLIDTTDALAKACVAWFSAMDGAGR
jgi:aspartate racemase